MRLLPLVALLTACPPPQSFGRCEGNVGVYYRGDGSELARVSCAADERCVELSPRQAVCRLNEPCSRPTRACRGDALVVCNPGETLLERIDCLTNNHGKGTPGRCAPDTLDGADCVDADAGPCLDWGFTETCAGGDRTLCRNGYTSVEAACNAASIDQGGTCRLNDAGMAVCAQPDAGSCVFHSQPCVDFNTHVVCQGGFLWTVTCAAGQTCGQQVSGDVHFYGCR